MRNLISRSLSILSVAPAVLLAAACGGDDDGDATVTPGFEVTSCAAVTTPHCVQINGGDSQALLDATNSLQPGTTLVLGASVKRAYGGALRESITADVVLEANGIVPIDQATRAKVRAVPGVADAVPLAEGRLRVASGSTVGIRPDQSSRLAFASTRPSRASSQKRPSPKPSASGRYSVTCSCRPPGRCRSTRTSRTKGSCSISVATASSSTVNTVLPASSPSMRSRTSRSLTAPAPLTSR